MKNTKLFIVAILIAISSNVFAQNVAINDDGTAPNSNAILDIDVSTNDKGILYFKRL